MMPQPTGSAGGLLPRQSQPRRPSHPWRPRRISYTGYRAFCIRLPPKTI